MCLILVVWYWLMTTPSVDSAMLTGSIPPQIRFGGWYRMLSKGENMSHNLLRPEERSDTSILWEERRDDQDSHTKHEVKWDRSTHVHAWSMTKNKKPVRVEVFLWNKTHVQNNGFIPEIEMGSPFLRKYHLKCFKKEAPQGFSLFSWFDSLSINKW